MLVTYCACHVGNVPVTMNEIPTYEIPGCDKELTPVYEVLPSDQLDMESNPVYDDVLTCDQANTESHTYKVSSCDQIKTESNPPYDDVLTCDQTNVESHTYDEVSSCDQVKMESNPPYDDVLTYNQTNMKYPAYAVSLYDQVNMEPNPV